MKGTIICLTYKDIQETLLSDELVNLVNGIKKKMNEEEGLKIYISSEIGAKHNIHHHILINRRIEVDLEKEWGNGHHSINYIESDDHYRKALDYVIGRVEHNQE